MISSIYISSRGPLYFCSLLVLAGIYLTASCSNSFAATAGSLSIAILPVENLSGSKAPIKEIGQLLTEGLKGQGLDIINGAVLEEFMARHRVRYTGAVDTEISQSLGKETGAEAVLITSVELYDDRYPPKTALISRLVSVGDMPKIIWMDSTGLSGDDAPGILGLGIVEEPRGLLEKAVHTLLRSLSARLSGGKQAFSAIKKERLQPKSFYRSSVLSSGMKYKIAVMPFLNRSDRKNAGDIMMLQFVDEFSRSDRFEVIEPGIVRDDLLRYRVIMNEGISFSDAELIFLTLRADADLILSGTVMDYQDDTGSGGAPKADFSVMVIEKKSRDVVWTSRSYAAGDDRVFFFDRGRINTAHELASGMAGTVVALIAE